MTTGVLEQLRVAWGLLLGGDPGPLREWLLGFGAWAPIASAALHILSALVPFLPGFVVAIANGMLFGAFWGGILTFFTASLGAAACFGIARAAGRPFVERIVAAQRLARLDRFMERRGVLAVFLGRIIPFINPDIVSYAAGATKIGWVPFLAAMGAGALPATVFYSIVGAYAVDVTGRVLLMVTAASLIPLGVLWLFRERLGWLAEWVAPMLDRNHPRRPE